MIWDHEVVGSSPTARTITLSRHKWQVVGRPLTFIDTGLGQGYSDGVMETIFVLPSTGYAVDAEGLTVQRICEITGQKYVVEVDANGIATAVTCSDLSRKRLGMMRCVSEEEAEKSSAFSFFNDRYYVAS